MAEIQLRNEQIMTLRKRTKMRMIYAITAGDCATTTTFADNLGIHNRNVWIRSAKFPVRRTVP